ncbi:MAG: ABC transporter substrate-binding protein, partial [Chloroflexi bacterium]|nr:ABC transporter substrate-binding protein [Chloroflexota bacterium]
MQIRKLTLMLGALSATALLIAAACGPATEPESGGTQTGAPNGTTSGTTSGATTTPSGGSTSTNAIAAAASMSGIPLDPAAKYGGILELAVTGFGPSFSPWEERSGGTGAVVDPISNHIVQNQSWGTPEDIATSSWFTLQPDLATSWEQSADGLSWAFHFRDDVKWSDGVAFTCADAKWSLDSIRTGEGLKRSPAATHFLAVNTINCTDDRTMVINLKQPKASLLTVVGLPFNQIRPKHVYENNFDVLREQPPTVGTGPFKIADFVPGEKIRFERRADYWNSPFPYLDGISLQILAQQAIDTGLRAGRLDFGALQGYNGAQLKTLRQECASCTFYEKIVNPSFNDVVMVNHQRAPFNDPMVKDAISYALDRGKINQLVYLGDNIPAAGGP